MARYPKDYIPKYRLHRQSGQAIVTIQGKDFLLGAHGSEASHKKYKRHLAEWLSGRLVTLPAALPPAPAPTLSELVRRFLDHAEIYYRRDGEPTGEAQNYRHISRGLTKLYGSWPADAFTLNELKAFRDHLVRLRWERKFINRQIKRLLWMLRWCAEERGNRHAIGVLPQV